MESKVSIVWFRNDLRLHDNEAIFDALQASDQIIPIYIFDERLYEGKTSFGFDKVGKYRTRFILESINDLKQKLIDLGTDLIVLRGNTEELIMDLALSYKTSWVFCNRERTDEEVKIQDAVEQKLWSIGREMRYSRGKMLYYTADLPFPVTHTPDSFANFKKEVEKLVKIRKPLEADLSKLKPFDTIEKFNHEFPQLVDFGYEDFNIEKGLALKGGESAALEHLNYYLWETDLAKAYKLHRNELLGRDFSTKFSAYLSQGCISPKKIYHELKAYENDRGANDSTYWIFFELMWRDYFRLVAKKHGNAIFKKEGIKGLKFENKSEDMALFQKWASGQTGNEFVDANMHELNATGFMSNRGRQNVASYLIYELGLNRIMGAEYFESLLVDYDPCSNYGNWNYIAGRGNSTDERRFNIELQAKKYDPKHLYIDYWTK